eukprot:jgi/Ulvmu1/11478/UM077_0022.1
MSGRAFCTSRRAHWAVSSGPAHQSCPSGLQALLCVRTSRICESRASTGVVELASGCSDVSGATTATFINRSVGSNETIDVSDTLVVMGDCKRGSSIRSDASIIVLGRLLGDVVAGHAGDRSAVVTAGDLQPSRLKIADVTAKPAYWRKTGSIYGQMAYISNEALSVPLPDRDELLGPEPGLGQQSRIRTQSQLSVDVEDSHRQQESITVVPLARPYLSFGPASSQLLRESSGEPLKESGKSAMITAAYAVTLGAILMVAPMRAFSLLFDPATVTKGFIRLGGGLLAVFGLYYWGAAVGCQRGSGVQGFYTATVIGRLFLALLCLTIFSCGEIGPGILFFGVMNAIGAAMMGRSMQSDGSM